MVSSAEQRLLTLNLMHPHLLSVRTALLGEQAAVRVGRKKHRALKAFDKNSTPQDRLSALKFRACVAQLVEHSFSKREVWR